MHCMGKTNVRAPHGRCHAPWLEAAKNLRPALGRRLDYYDRPAVRKTVRDASAHEYRRSSVILGIVESSAFRMRASYEVPALAR